MASSCLGRPRDYVPRRVRQSYEGANHLSSEFLAQQLVSDCPFIGFCLWIGVDKWQVVLGDANAVWQPLGDAILTSPPKTVCLSCGSMEVGQRRRER